SPKARQNNSSGTVAGRVPVGVKSRRTDRWPSWKIQTSAPNVALRLRTLRTSALMGTRMLPNIMNRSTKVASAINPATTGSREDRDAFESRSSADEDRERRGVLRTDLASRSPASEYGSTAGTTDSQVASRATKRGVIGPGPAT